MVITLDSGHYGKYNQSPVIKSFYESEFNWKMTNKLAKYLKQYGITVRLTRSELNRDKALYERGLMAKGSDMFISIHANACDDSAVDYKDSENQSTNLCRLRSYVKLHPRAYRKESSVRVR
mgnify:CR=1 FL=1